MQVWIFGDLWCSAWLALDVWMCTASILNLCAISLDRYVAVTRPVTYPSIMSMGRAKILIAAVWVLSFLICLPPLLGWKDKSIIEGESPEPRCPWVCEITSEKGYVIYSALGSFYLPMLVMMFFYWRIYRAAVHTTKAINQGFRTTKGSRTLGNRFDEQRLTLRIHRGRGSVMQGSSGSNSTTTTNSAANSVVNSTTNSPGGPGAKSPRKERRHERIKISVSYPSSDAISSVVNNNGTTPDKSPPSPSANLYAAHCEGGSFRKDTLRVSPTRKGRRSNSDAGTTPRPKMLGDPLSVSIQKDLSPSPTFEENNKPKLISRMGKRNIKAQVKRFRMETKAAKTLGIIVGGFIFCWFPFFTMYLARAFCIDADCIHPTVFSILFWLGYANSAINPCIYALFSKDFRFAFKRIICRFLCSKEPRSRGSSRYRRRGSDGSALGVRRAEQGRSASITNNNDFNQHQSDSDPNNDLTESR